MLPRLHRARHAGINLGTDRDNKQADMNKVLERAMLHAQHCQSLINKATRPKSVSDTVDPVTIHRMPKAKEGFKICSYCQKVKPVEEFYFADKTTGRRAGRCKECHHKVCIEQQRRRREINKLKQLTK